MQQKGLLATQSVNHVTTNCLHLQPSPCQRLGRSRRVVLAQSLVPREGSSGCTSRRVRAAAAAKRPGEGSPDDDVSSVTGLAKALVKDVMTGLNTTGGRPARLATAPPPPEDLRSPTYAIAAACTVTFLACALVPLLPASALLLNHKQPMMWQLLTSCFAHSSLEGLLQTVFFTYIFGRVVERSHGAVATWATYLSCGAAAAALAWWMLPAKAALLSSAAPAAAWGLFLVGVALPRLPAKPLEVLCLAPFACAATLARYSHLSGALAQGATATGHLVHVVGASVAACVVAAVLGVVERLRQEAEERRREEQRKADAANTEAAVTRVFNIASQAAQQLGKKLG